jgi:serine/threonine protein kinase
MSPAEIPSTREQRVNELIAAYLEALAAGQAPNRQDLLARHPDLAAELRAFFADRDRFAQAAGQLGPPVAACRTVGEAPTPAAGAPSAPASARKTVRYFGDYELLEEIARGGMGVVYKARQVSLNRTVALKMILAGQLASAAEVQRFKTEAEAAAQLDYPHIVPIYEVGEHEGQHYFSMKLVEGGSLGDRVPGLLRDPRAAARLLAQVARAVHYAHQRGILHRDLKPANILLAPNPKSESRNPKQTRNPNAEGPKPPGDKVSDLGHSGLGIVSDFGIRISDLVPVVTDFDLARRVEKGGSLTQSGAVVGTPGYMAPEQVSGKKGLTTAADIFSLGAILYECLTGRPPFQGATPLETLVQTLEHEPRPPRSLNPHADRDLQTIALKCLAREPAKRYGSAEALAEDLERFLAGEPIRARPSAAWERTAKWARRRPAAAALVGVSVLAAAALLVLGLWFDAQLRVSLTEVGKQQAAVADARADVERLRTEAQEKERLLARQGVRAEGQRLAGQAWAELPTNPGLALLLAVEGAEHADRAQSREAAHNNALLAALRQCRERLTLRGPEVHPAYGFRPNVSFTSARYSPDGGRIATLRMRLFLRGDDDDGGPLPGDVLTICDARTGRTSATVKVAGAPIDSATFSPDGRTIATTLRSAAVVRLPDGRECLYTNASVRLWDAATGRELLLLKGHADYREWGMRSESGPGGTTLLKTGHDATGKRVEVDVSKETPHPDGHTDRVVSVDFSPDGKRLLTASWDRTARIWDVATGKPRHVLYGGRAGVVHAAAFSPDGKWLVTAADDWTARVWDADTGAEWLTLAGHQGPVFAAEFSPDGRRVVTASADGSVRAWPVDPLPAARARKFRDLTAGERARFGIGTDRE